MKKEHIDTAPVWEAYRAGGECPLCAIRKRVEGQNVDYFLGESVMEPDQRIEVNDKGFCAVHFKQLYDAGNRLGLGLMTHTHLKEVLRRLRAMDKEIRAGADAAAGRSFIGRLAAKKGPEPASLKKLQTITNGCVICERVRTGMERYVYTLLYMYKHEPEFPALFKASKGVCLDHLEALLAAAPAELSGGTLKSFVDTLMDVELENLERMEKEVEWFTQKFDYRNEDKPWGNSRDAVKRTVNKLRHQVIDD